MPRPGRLGPGRAGGGPGRGPGALRRVVPLRLAAARLRRAAPRSRGAGGRDHRAAQPGRSGPGPRHRPRRLGAGQHRLVPAPAAARSPTGSAERMGALALAPGAHGRGLEVGMLLGWMSTRVLGQYDLLVIEDGKPRGPGPRLLRRPQRARPREALRLPAREFRLWLALHEVTHRAQFTGVPVDARALPRPGRADASEAVDADPKRFLDALGRAVDEIRGGRNPLDDGGIACCSPRPSSGRSRAGSAG